MTLSRRVFAHGKASKRRCSTPTASFDNAVREQTHDGLPLNIKKIGATRMAQLGVAALDKGWAIACTPRALPVGREPRLDLSHSCSPECHDIYVLVSKIGNHDPPLVDALAPVAKDLQFGRILQMIQSSNRGYQAQKEAGEKQ